MKNVENKKKLITSIDFAFTVIYGIALLNVVALQYRIALSTHQHDHVPISPR